MDEFLPIARTIVTVFALGGYVPYLFAIVRRTATPNAATWWIWSTVGAIIFASIYDGGDRNGIGLLAAYAIGPLLTAILATRFGKSQLDRFDLSCLGAAACGVALWFSTGNEVFALSITMTIEIIGALPTFRQTFSKPDSEDSLTWGMFWIANTINLFVIVATRDWNSIASLSYYIWLFVLPTIIMTLVLRGKVLSRQPQS